MVCRWSLRLAETKGPERTQKVKPVLDGQSREAVIEDVEGFGLVPEVMLAAAVAVLAGWSIGGGRGGVRLRLIGAAVVADHDLDGRGRKDQDATHGRPPRRRRSQARFRAWASM